MSNQATDPVLQKTIVDGEAEGFARVEFYLESASQKTTPIHLAECGIGTAISGLKSDLQSLFNIPAEQQIWTLRNHVLGDNKTLACYGITGTESASTSRVAVRIGVKRTH